MSQTFTLLHGVSGSTKLLHFYTFNPFFASRAARAHSSFRKNAKNLQVFTVETAIATTAPLLRMQSGFRRERKSARVHSPQPSKAVKAKITAKTDLKTPPE